jgi:class 3 adenylate cyclase
LVFVLVAAFSTHRINFQFHGLAGFLLLGLLCLVLLSIPISLSAYLAFRFAHVSRSLNQRLLEVEALSKRTREQEEEKQRMLEQQNELLERQVGERTSEVLFQKEEIQQQNIALLEEKRKSDDLLLNILPAEVAEELKQKGSSVARHYDEVSVLFTDIVNFTHLAEQMDAQRLVQELNQCFSAFDAIVEKYGLQKIKTIGDAYMAVCGLPASDPQHAHNTVQAALEIRALMASKDEQAQPFRIRIGINSGPVVAGIIGVKKFAYDIWGDTVNTAARMEQHSEPGRINISSATYALVKDAFACTPRGMVQAKNKGEVEMYFVEGQLEPGLTSTPEYKHNA